MTNNNMHDQFAVLDNASRAYNMRELVARLNAASRAYYQEDREIMSDREYDALYDRLVQLEAETGIVLAASPTRKVGYEVVSALTKVPHDIPMLSLDKTKDVSALESFLRGHEGEHEGLLLWKLDGLSIVLRYMGGQLSQALTRGNGQIGEDVTHNAKVFANIPFAVPYKGNFSVRGEAVITFPDFEAINANLGEEDVKYKNPRNLCSGTIRQLNSQVAAERRVLFFAFGVAQPAQESGQPDNEDGRQRDEDSPQYGPPPQNKKSNQLRWLQDQGFDVDAHRKVTAQNVSEAVEDYKKIIPELTVATDGLVLTYDNIAYSASLGATSKFPRDSLAFKWADEIAETTLLDIEWNPSRTGLINPVAIFEAVEIEGSVVSRASLHNVSILRGLELGVGDKITVYKANMIIPQVAENLTRSNTAEIPAVCPTCGGETAITVQRAPAKTVSTSEPDPEGEVLTCINPTCGAKQMQSLVHFVGRDGLNIEGLSEQTLEKLLAHGVITSYPDIFTLSQHEAAILSIEGIGRRLYEKLQASIEKAKDIALPNFIYALGIRHVGLANAKLLSAHFDHDFDQVAAACQSSDYMEILAEIKGFGDTISHSLHAYFTQATNMETARATIAHLRIQAPAIQGRRPLTDLNFVITGDVRIYPNRKALQNHIESQGGRVTSSVTAKTSYLINNDSKSQSSKNKKAAELGVSVITEDEFQKISEKGTTP